MLPIVMARAAGSATSSWWQARRWPVRSSAGSWRRPAKPASSSTCSRRSSASRSHYWASDVDREREEARERLEASLAWAAAQGFAAKGEVGDPDPLVAIEDELRDFGADEVIIATHSREHTSWLAKRMLGHLARELDVPVREIVVGDDRDRSPVPPGPPDGVGSDTMGNEPGRLRHRLALALVAAILVGVGGVIGIVANGGKESNGGKVTATTPGRDRAGRSPRRCRRARLRPVRLRPVPRRAGPRRRLGGRARAHLRRRRS